MAYSTQRATSDGSLQLLMLSIVFFDQAEIKVFLNELPTTAFTWATAKSIRFNTVLPAGTQVLIRRTSELGEVRHVFSRGAQFKNETLDDNFQQILNIAQEAVEGANVGDIYSQLNMHGNQIINLADATSPQGAVTLAQYQRDAAGASAARTGAEAARDLALAHRNAAEKAAGDSKGSADKSEASAQRSEAQVNLAKVHADRSKVEADRSTAQVALSKVEADRSTENADRSRRWSDTAENVIVEGTSYSSLHYSRKSANSAVLADTKAAEATREADRAKTEADKLGNMNLLAAAIKEVTAGAVEFNRSLIAGPTVTVKGNGTSAPGVALQTGTGTAVGAITADATQMVFWTNGTNRAAMGAGGMTVTGDIVATQSIRATALLHAGSGIQVNGGSSVGRGATIGADGNIWMAWVGDWISNQMIRPATLGNHLVYTNGINQIGGYAQCVNLNAVHLGYGSVIDGYWLTPASSQGENDTNTRLAGVWRCHGRCANLHNALFQKVS